MYLSKVEIKNFRNLKDVSIDLAAGLNVLVGPNSVGKTNIFDAIRVAMGAEASRAEPIWLSIEDLHCGSANVQASSRSSPIHQSDTISIRLTFIDLNDDQVSQFFEILDFQSVADIKRAPAKINFEAVWQPKKNRYQVARWGGSEAAEPNSIPVEIIQALPVVYLPALRNAEEALTPGNKSILARVLEDLAQRLEGSHESEFEKIFEVANDSLAKQPLVERFQDRLRVGTQEMAGSAYTKASVQAAEPKFRRILRTLQVVLDDEPVKEITHSGMGYNNLLFIATILSHLEKATADDKKSNFECPVVLIEEPEAHLNPQNTLLLGKYLSGLGIPQVLASTHSPTFASHVKPTQVQVVFRRDDGVKCNALRLTGLVEREERQLQRMLDITRATLYFARGIILVEGLSEALLLPEFALGMDIDLRKKHISVVPICGVDFGVFEKMFKADCLDIPVAIITDSDPSIERKDPKVKPPWDERKPILGEKCARLVELEKIFGDRSNVKVCYSSVTLEYDLAKAGTNNPEIMAAVWESSFKGMPKTFNKKMLVNLTHEEQVLVAWRGICQAETSGSKADFAQLLADWLYNQRNTSKDTGERSVVTFEIPKYFKEAIDFVSSKLT